MLVRKQGNWRVRTDSGIDWPKPWSRETFVELFQYVVVRAQWLGPHHSCRSIIRPMTASTRSFSGRRSHSS